ncbi:permease [Clostridium polyendosporum]|uniref:Permease n=1 Tax=Clostridium polyendosporum TaxID=69208 RepID=A0A919RZK8_9CLOT|nr:DMT family transporter [Clostridium polyendosporum]GIM28616.1 permease [Clostridium polyendosporum]
MKEKNFFEKRRNVIITAFFCSILWGSAFPVLKVSYKVMNMKPNDLDGKITLAGLRFFIASILLFIFVKVILKIRLKISVKDFYMMLILGGFQTTLTYFFFYNGLANTSAMKGTIIGTLENFLVVILAHFFYADDKISLSKIIGLVTGLFGVIIVSWGQSFEVQFNFSGEGFMILSALFATIATFLAKNLGRKINPFLMTAWQMFLGSSVMLLWGVPRLSDKSIVFNINGYILLIYSALLSAIAFSLWYMLLKYQKPGEISLYRFMIPVSGSILSSIFIPGERLTLNILIALIFVSLGIIFTNYSEGTFNKAS